MDALDFAIKVQPLLVFILSFASVGIAFLGYKEYKLKRTNDLFDRRYKFYKMVEKWWLSTGDEDNPPTDITDVLPMAIEADFIFGKDIFDHIVSLQDKTHSGSPFFPNDDFSQPFRKYLTLK